MMGCVLCQCGFLGTVLWNWMEYAVQLGWVNAIRASIITGS